MNGGLIMEMIKTRLNADLLTPIIDIPASMLGKDVDITIVESKSVVDELYGVAANLNMSLEDIRDERLSKQ